MSMPNVELFLEDSEISFKMINDMMDDDVEEWTESRGKKEKMVKILWNV